MSPMLVKKWCQCLLAIYHLTCDNNPTFAMAIIFLIFFSFQEIVARFVALIPFVSDNVVYPGLCDIWSTCDVRYYFIWHNFIYIKFNELYTFWKVIKVASILSKFARSKLNWNHHILWFTYDSQIWKLQESLHSLTPI